MKSCIKNVNGVPTLFVNGSPVPAVAYTTYFQERNCYREFIEAGYRIFFINVSFTKKPFNSVNTGFSSFRVGAFENPDLPDYSELEDYVNEILGICPDAMIIPRIYVSMPSWWSDSHPDETVLTPKGGYKEMLFSEQYRKDGAELLSRMVKHIRASSYASSIIGWQICGGQTQEWFHPDHFGSFCDAAEKYYRKWAKKTYGEENATLPKREEFCSDGEAVCKNENVKRYLEFCNFGVTQTMEYFAKRLKQETNFEQVVGTFYGYSLAIPSALTGSHGLRYLLDSPYFDYFCSPCSYWDSRPLGQDWKDQFPVDAIKLHSKLPFIECDIRTYLTKSIQQSRPGEYPEDIYPQNTKSGNSLWVGPPTALLSREALRKTFCHQITKALAIWWFDMWGGWYSDKLLMDDIDNMRRIYSENCPFEPSDIGSEVVFFADESAFANILKGHPLSKSIFESHANMGCIGAPYDTHMVEDAKKVLSKYKAAVFASPVPSKAGKEAISLCQSMKIPCLVASVDHAVVSCEEIRDLLLKADVHTYTEQKDVIYVGNGYLGIHAATEGEKTITLPAACRISPVFGADIKECITDKIVIELKQYQTALFTVKRV